MEPLTDRTKRFARDIIQFSKGLGTNYAVRVIQQQLVRSGTSVAANYRAACRAQSKATFIAKLAIVEEEADETLFWLELLEEVGFDQTDSFKALKDEANQITAIIVASRKTAKRNRKS